ncbi:DUF3383 family protein [Salmonella enterica]|nr:DUF3383 family protein [Salmonella enterica]EAW2472593.1 DUF3383 domain-containing protein [Salmonella enterica subsp. enterica]EBX0540085.1 hypothetical protein [Salmonella enterica subsp. enterica serovar 4,[5],12:i:-]ECG8628444.1 DUF3383 domain-containing protein [Salmonella enterica subsp. diarizonae]EDV6614056.1 DUF3383 domain-containing protein [Salmonella enterica subsp. enterica serovar Gaminara]EDX2067163.1 DUF3383 domain-containing protein [Salmonella enterica subsp. enterica sero
MANLSRLFSVKIGRQTTAAQYGVFGVGIILAPGAAFFGLKYSTYESAKIENFNDLYRVYTSADDAVSDGMNGDNLLAVQAYFSQSPAPDTLVVGDFSAAYSKTMIRLTGVPVAGAPAATKATIGYVKGGEYRYAKFNGTAWSGSAGATADIVADSGAEGQFLVDGRIVYLEGAEVVHKSSTALSSAVSSAVAAIKNQYNKFFMSMTTSRDLSIQKAIADWTESQIDKMAVFIDDYSSPTWATDSITKYIHDKNMAGSFAVSTKREKNFLDAALAGRCLVMQPGSETWALKTLNAAQADDFTETDYQKIQALNGNTFEDYGSGITVTYPGTCGDGESIEVVRFCYWQADRMQKDLATLFVNRNKIGHDMPGYEVVCNKMESSLKAGQTAGGIIENFTDENGDLIRGFEVVRPTMAEVSATQRIKGDLTVKFKFYLRYAIKHVDAIGSAMTYGI